MSRGILSAVIATCVFALLFAWLAGVPHLDLDQPISYRGDALEMLAYYNRDYVDNDMDTRLHAPFELQHEQRWHYLYNALFQSNSNLIWLSSIAAGGDVVRTPNFAFLATFLLTFLTAYWTCGRLGLNNPYRFGAASLYALMPYHFQRGVNHFWEASYYLTPLLALQLMRIWSARPLAHRWDGNGWRLTWRDPRAVFAVVLIVFFSSFHPYHQFFFACLAASVAPFAALYRRNFRPLMVGLAMSVLALAVLALKQALVAEWTDPEAALFWNNQAIGGYGGAELYPLKLIQLLLPVQGHRWKLLADLRAFYDAANPLNNENGTTSLGFFGAFGLVAAMFTALVPAQKWRLSRVGKMGMLILMILLFASMGGISSLISSVSCVLLGTQSMLTQARGWNRMVIFAGFFSYFAAFWFLRLGLNELWRRRAQALPKFVVAGLLFAPVFAVVLWDATTGPIHPGSPKHYQSDRQFFGELEALLPEGSRVLQQPFLVHHEMGWIQPGVYYTEGLRPYINTRTLHFTYGGDTHTAQTYWLKAVSNLPAAEAAQYLCAFSFSAVLLQRNMFTDPAIAETAWAAAAGTTPLRSADGDYVAFDLRPYCAQHPVPMADGAARSKLLSLLRAHAHVIPGAAMASQIGHARLENTRPVLAGGVSEDGWLAYGPYETLPPGRYEVIFALRLHPAANGGPVVLDVNARRSGTETQLAHTETRRSGDFEVRLPIVVDGETNSLEYRVMKPLGAELTLYEVRVDPGMVP